MAPVLTIAFSSHRSETLPLAADLMAAHDLVVVEEPPSAAFEHMLSGDMALGDYLLAADYEYPAFAEASCRLLRRLHRQGRRIIACEPFMERLIRIHDRLTDGGRPADLAAEADLWPVYQAEREATGRLLDFYRASADRDFDAMTTTAAAFAAADAARFVLRDRLRAAALAQLLAGCGARVYVEAGYLHLRLIRELRRRLPGAAIKPVYLLRRVYRAAGQHDHLYGPGDLLTLGWIFNRPAAVDRQHLLAARSLVYNQLIVKEEMAPGVDGFPDAHDDVDVIRYVNRLSREDCRRLYPRIAGKDPRSARLAAGGFPPADGGHRFGEAESL